MTKDLPIDEAYRAGASIRTLATLHGCRVSSMYTRLTRLGVKFRTNGEYSRNVPATVRATLLARYAAGETIQALADSVGRNYATMRNNLKRWGVQFRRNGPPRQLALNEHFFRTIDTEQKAYWLGFIEADGYVPRKCVSVELAAVDREHLIKLKHALQTEANITTTHHKATARSALPSHTAARLRVHSHILRDDLNRQLAKLTVPPHLLRHYFRGLFDGDGSLCLLTTGRQWQFSQLGSQTLLVTLKQWLLAQTGYTGGKLHFHNGIWQTAYKGNIQVPVIMNLLYDGATVFLDRKAAKVAEMNRQLSIDVNRKTAYTARQEVRNHV